LQYAYTLTIELVLVCRRHQEEEIKGHNHSFSSNRSLHHVFDHLLALEMMGTLLEIAAAAFPLGTGDNKWHRLGNVRFHSHQLPASYP
jgi:hypothetical protein